MKSSKPLNDKEEDAIGEIMLDAVTEMQVNNIVKMDTLDRLNTVVTRVFSLPRRTTIETKLQRTGERQWYIGCAVGGETLVETTITLPKITYIF